MKEFILYVTHLSFRRLVNLGLCKLGFLLSRIIRCPVNLGFPYSISIEPTTRCNLRCTDCITGISALKRNHGDMPIERFKHIIDQVHRSTISVLTHFQGEPLMNACIFEMIRYATSKRLVTEMATNATLIDEEIAFEMVKSGLKKVVITVDSVHETDFGFYRKGARFTDVDEGIMLISNAKKNLKSRYPLLVIEHLALKSNINHTNDFIDFANKRNADIVRVKTAQILSPTDDESSIPFNSKYSRYIKNPDGEISLKGKPNVTCSAPWSKLSITHDGWVVPCCFDKNAFYLMGSVNHWSIKEIWWSKQYNQLRKRLLHSRVVMPICSNCPQNRMRIDYPIW